MLSPGNWHRYVPRDLEGNLIFRRRLLAACHGNAENQRLVIEACRQDLLFYVNAFVWQFNPKKKGGGQVGPFITWPFQERALMDRPETTGRKGILWCYENDKPCVVEKSREMGASWMFLFLQDWLSGFHDYTKTLNISKDQAAVDSNDADSLFWKIRFMHEHLPDWLIGDVTEQSLYFGYDRTQSMITGASSTGRAGVGGRAGVVFVDEFPLIKEAKEVRQRTAGTADSRFFNGTHQGIDTEFYKLTQTPDFVKIQMHWTRHPDKNQGLYRYNHEKNKVDFLRYDPVTDKIEECDCQYEYPPEFAFQMDGSPTGGPHPGVRSPWYDWKSLVDIGDARAAAMELDINPMGSVSQFYPPLMIRDLVLRYAESPHWEGDLEYDKETGVPYRFVKRPGGLIRLWFYPGDDGPPRSTYGAGADISGGTGATPSCLSIVNGRTGEKVLEYVNANIYPQDFGVLAVAICSMFKDEAGEGAKLAWENHGPGTAFGKVVWKDLGYRSIYYKTGELDIRQAVSDQPGWHPTGPNKLLLHEEYREALRSRDYLNHSERALEETKAFKYTLSGSLEHSSYASKDPTAGRENHGDIVTADALSFKMVKGIKDSVYVPKRDEKKEPSVRSFAGRRKMREARSLEESAA